MDKAPRNNEGDGRIARCAAAALSVVASLLVVGSCSSPSAFQKPAKFKSLQQAVDINITTLSVARWEDYVAGLQPQFGITAAQAYQLAVPLTSMSQTSVAASLNASLQAGGAWPQWTPAAPSSAPASGAASSSPTPPAVGLPASPLPSPTIPLAQGVPLLSGTIATDPILTYDAAAAIYQDVTVLSRYVVDAALRYGYVPYVARIQVSVMPFARNEPYDLYLNLGFFSRCYGRDESDPQTPAYVVPLLVTDDVERGQAQNGEDIAQQLGVAAAWAKGNLNLGGNLSALKDAMTAALSSNLNSLFMVSRGSSDNVLEVRFGAALNPSVRSRYAMLTQTHNVTVVILVRSQDAAISPANEQACAPSFTSSSATAWAGRPWDSGPTVDVVSVAHLRDANSGKELGVTPATDLSHAREVVRRFTVGTSASISDNTIRELLQRVVRGSDVDFRELQSSLPEAINLTPGRAAALWTGLAEAAGYSEYRSIHFNLPYPASHAAVQNQTIFVEDNCKDTATVSINGPGDYAANQYVAELILRSDSDSQTDLDLQGTYDITASSIAQAASGSPWTLTFPSLHRMSRVVRAVRGACANTSGVPPLPQLLKGAQLIIRRSADHRWFNVRESTETGTSVSAMDPSCLDACTFTFSQVMFDGSVQLAQTAGLAATSDTIVADPHAGTGSVRLVVKVDKDLDSVLLTFSGSTLTTLPTVTGNATVTATNGGLSVAPTTPGVALTTVVLDVAMQGLVPGRAVMITGTGQKSQKPAAGAAPVLVIPIVAPAIVPRSTWPGV